MVVIWLYCLYSNHKKKTLKQRSGERMKTLIIILICLLFSCGKKDYDLENMLDPIYLDGTGDMMSSDGFYSDEYIKQSIDLEQKDDR